MSTRDRQWVEDHICVFWVVYIPLDRNGLWLTYWSFKILKHTGTQWHDFYIFGIKLNIFNKLDMFFFPFCWLAERSWLTCTEYLFCSVLGSTAVATGETGWLSIGRLQLRIGCRGTGAAGWIHACHEGWLALRLTDRWEVDTLARWVGNHRRSISGCWWGRLEYVFDIFVLFNKGGPRKP